MNNNTNYCALRETFTKALNYNINRTRATLSSVTTPNRAVKFDASCSGTRDAFYLTPSARFNYKNPALLYFARPSIEACKLAPLSLENVSTHFKIYRL